jgi:hypothetical protein
MLFSWEDFIIYMLKNLGKIAESSSNITFLVKKLEHTVW